MDGHDENRLEAGIASLLTSVMQLQLAERRVEGRIAAEIGLSQSDVLALALLVRSKQQTIGQIATDLDLSPGSTSTLVNRLTKAGLVVRVPNPLDGRSVIITASPRGVRAVRAVRDQYADAVRNAAAAVTDDCIHTAAKVVQHTAHQLNQQTYAEQRAS